MTPNNKQRGSTLLVALIMLVVLTLLVISAIRSSSTNLRIAGNMQTQEGGVAGAQQSIEAVISSSNFVGSTASSVMNVDINRDGTTDYTVKIDAATCTGSKALQNNSPNLPSECLSSGAQQNTGIFFASGVQRTGTSWCYAQQWDVKATVQDSQTGTMATMHQGVSLDLPAGKSGC